MSPLRDALRDLPDGVFFDLLESEEAYLVVLDVPGVSAETVDVTVEDGAVSIEARREKDLPEEYRYVEENRSLFFDATLPLPRDVTEGDDAEATVTNGVLEVLLPKDDGGGGVEDSTAGGDGSGPADDPLDSSVEVGSDDEADDDRA